MTESLFPPTDEVDLQAILSVFAPFRIAGFGDLYLIRDDIALDATSRLGTAHEVESLLDLEAFLRAIYAVALNNELPTAGIVAYANLWREKLAAIARCQSPCRDAMAAAPVFTFSLHRYSFQALLDAVAAGLSVPFDQHTSLDDIPLPQQARRDIASRLVTSRRILSKAANRAPRFEPGHAEPVSTASPGPFSLRSVVRSDLPPTPVQPEILRTSLRYTFLNARRRGRTYVKLPTAEIGTLAEQPLFLANPDLILKETVDIIGFLHRYDNAPESQKVGLARDLRDAKG